MAKDGKMTKKEIAEAIASAPKTGLARLLEAVRSCPKTVKALTTKVKKEEAQRNLQKKKKDKRLDVIFF